MQDRISRAILTIDDPNIEFELINCMLRIALDYELCDVRVSVDENGTRFYLSFNEDRTAVFILEWIKFWMRPFGIPYRVGMEQAVTASKVMAVA